MTDKIDLDHIARRLGATRGGRVKASGGHFGAIALAIDKARRQHVSFPERLSRIMRAGMAGVGIPCKVTVANVSKTRLYRVVIETLEDNALTHWELQNLAWRIATIAIGEMDTLRICSITFEDPSSRVKGKKKNKKKS